MAIIRMDQPLFRNPWAELERMRREFDSLFRGWGTEFAPGVTVFPPLNISEDEHNIYVRAEIPGIKPADLDIAVEGDTLTIKGERKDVSGEEKVSYHRREIERGRFSRAVTLPTKVEPDKVTAEAKNGVLVITLPKAEEVKPRKITVKAD